MHNTFQSNKASNRDINVTINSVKICIQSKNQKKHNYNNNNKKKKSKKQKKLNHKNLSHGISFFK